MAFRPRNCQAPEAIETAEGHAGAHGPAKLSDTANLSICVDESV